MRGGWRGGERFGGIGRGLDRQLVFVMMAEEELRWLRNLSRTACSRCLLYIPHTKHACSAVSAAVTRMHEVRCVAAPQSRLSDGLDDSFLPHTGCKAFLASTSLTLCGRLGRVSPPCLEVGGGNRWVDLAVGRCGMNVKLLTSDFRLLPW